MFGSSLKLQVNIVGAGTLYMPLGLSLFVKLLQTHPFLPILYFDLLISMIGQSRLQPCRTGGTRAHADSTH